MTMPHEEAEKATPEKPKSHGAQSKQKRKSAKSMWPVNWMLMVCTISLVAGFQSSSKLAAAYGLAVTSTMIINTVLFFVVIRRQWHWSLMWAAALAGLFLMVDVPFFAANISKIYHGAWFPLVIAETSAMARWRTNLFIFMSRNAADATSFFNLPADQTIEVGVRLEI